MRRHSLTEVCIIVDLQLLLLRLLLPPVPLLLNMTMMMMMMMMTTTMFTVALAGMLCVTLRSVASAFFIAASFILCYCDVTSGDDCSDGAWC